MRPDMECVPGVFHNTGNFVQKNPDGVKIQRKQAGDRYGTETFNRR